jgi:hypothetical protein
MKTKIKRIVGVIIVLMIIYTPAYIREFELIDYIKFTGYLLGVVLLSIILTWLFTTD